MVLPASRLLPSSGGRGRLTNKIATLLVNLQDNEQDLRAIVPLLTKVVEKASDGEIWDAVYKLATKSASRVIPLGELTPPAELTLPISSMRCSPMQRAEGIPILLTFFTKINSITSALFEVQHTRSFNPPRIPPYRRQFRLAQAMISCFCTKTIS